MYVGCIQGDDLAGMAAGAVAVSGAVAMTVRSSQRRHCPATAWVLLLRWVLSEGKLRSRFCYRWFCPLPVTSTRCKGFAAHGDLRWNLPGIYPNELTSRRGGTLGSNAVGRFRCARMRDWMLMSMSTAMWAAHVRGLKGGKGTLLG